MGEKAEDLAWRRQQAAAGGGMSRLEALHATGRATARERIDALVDSDSFVEIDALITHRNRDGNMHMHPQFGDGVIAGHGTVDGRRVFCFSQDFTVFGGSMGEMHANKISKVVEMAERARVPIICIWDGGGQRAHDGVHSLAATGEMLDYFVSCSGRVPMISLVLGPVVGVSALAAALADFVILGEAHGQLFLSSPLETEETASGEMTTEEVGGAQMHASRSGICCLTASDEDDAMEIAIELLSFFPDYCGASPPHLDSGDPHDRDCPELMTIIPDDSNRPYDMVKVIQATVDNEHFVELFPIYAE
ncbi:MAG: hypothetical protein NZ802_00560, partial [Candidatus Poseidoniales archaeon]|nr:hypothetical protein [Candidatus Poseidoniales archaeon]